MFENIPLILAQEGEAPTPQAPSADAPVDGVAPQTPTNGAPPPQPTSPFGGMGFLLVMVAAFALIMIFSSRSQRAEKKKREVMLAAIKKGDKVQTIGGILGTVIEVRDSDVLVKVDESTNARIRFARSGIQSIVQDKE